MTRRFAHRLHRRYIAFTVGLVLFIACMALLERKGWSRTAIGACFLIGTVLVYAGIGLMSRTTDEAEYYVAGRRVPAMYNGMATAADWMSAASFRLFTPVSQWITSTETSSGIGIRAAGLAQGVCPRRSIRVNLISRRGSRSLSGRPFVDRVTLRSTGVIGGPGLEFRGFLRRIVGRAKQIRERTFTHTRSLTTSHHSRPPSPDSGSTTPHDCRDRTSGH